MLNISNIFKAWKTSLVAVLLSVALFVANATGKVTDTALAAGIALITALFVSPDKAKSENPG